MAKESESKAPTWLKPHLPDHLQHEPDTLHVAMKLDEAIANLTKSDRIRLRRLLGELTEKVRRDGVALAQIIESQYRRQERAAR